MSSKVIVVVADLDNAAHGEINIMESQEEAAQLVETLIESGYDQERVRAFAADEFRIRVYHRPVVALTTAGETDAAEQPESHDASDEDDQAEDDQGDDVPVESAEAAASLLTVEAAPEPFTKNGQRFSAQFGPA